ncbi:MAG: hypothetical protein KDA42_07610 [Planctomycetales bacterium]|nr:hypothetical protein [Planctomycetales bacterium]
MISDELLEMLICPLSKQPLARADEALLAAINTRIEEGRLTNRAGEKVETPIAAGLLRDDGHVLYVVRDDIPVMLADEAIDLEQLG